MNKLRQRTRKLNISEQIHLAKRLGFLISSGMPLLESLEMLRKNTQSKKLALTLKAITGEISNGSMLSHSFEKEKVFHHFGIYVTEVGETSGTLGTSLSYIAQELSKKKILRQKIQGALIYPFFISVASIILSVLLITFIFPKILPILSSVNGSLPLATRTLLLINNFLRQFWWFILVTMILSAIIFGFLFRKNKVFRTSIEKVILHLPYLKNFIIYYQVGAFARTLGLLLKSRLVLTKGVSMIADHVSHTLYKRSYRQMHADLLQGGRLSASMKKDPHLFPSLFKEMTEVGETTGKLSESLLYLAELYEIELEEKARSLGSALEPILMIFMGIAIGGVALSIIMPIYQITANLQH